MATPTGFDKDPNAVLDYVVDWTDWLGEDTIQASQFIVPTGLVLDSHTNDAKTTTVWLSGGEDLALYDVVNRIVTVGGRQEDHTIRFKIAQK